MSFFCTKIKETNGRCVIGVLKDLGPHMRKTVLTQ